MFVCQGKKFEIDVPFSLAMGLRVCTHCVRTVRHCVILYQGYNAPNIKKYIYILVLRIQFEFSALSR